MSSAPVVSMTGFSSIEGEISGRRMRLEIKTLNHRFLDVKLRIPREFSSAELPLRAAIQARLSRGSLEFKMDRAADTETAPPPIQANLGLAAHYYESLVSIQKTLGLTDPIRIMDIAHFPEVITQGSSELQTDEAWNQMEPLVKEALNKLVQMRQHEGAALSRVLFQALDEMEETATRLRKRRAECETAYRQKIRDKVTAIFEAYPLAEASIQTALESRISQELSLLIDRTDIEEELVRFKGHLDHFRKVLTAGGPVGRKLDFILQELNREINTMGNKAQDLQMSEEVVTVKVRLEQLREQVMNLE